MRRLSALPLLAATLALAGASSAAEAPDAAALLRAIVGTYTAGPAFDLGFVQTYAPSGFPDVTPEKGTLTIQAPASLRFDYEGSEGKVYTFDGKAARQYVAADRQIVLKTLTASERARLPLLFLQPASEVLERFEAAAKSTGDGLVELTLTPRTESDLRSLLVQATPSGVVRRLVVLDAEGNRTGFTFTRPTPRKPRPASDFALVPPKGTRVVGE